MITKKETIKSFLIGISITFLILVVFHITGIAKFNAEAAWTLPAVSDKTQKMEKWEICEALRAEIVDAISNTASKGRLNDIDNHLKATFYLQLMKSMNEHSGIDCDFTETAEQVIKAKKK